MYFRDWCVYYNNFIINTVQCLSVIRSEYSGVIEDSILIYMCSLLKLHYSMRKGFTAPIKQAAREYD
jgi:hypothetical protein